MYSLENQRPLCGDGHSLPGERKERQGAASNDGSSFIIGDKDKPVGEHGSESEFRTPEAFQREGQPLGIDKAGDGQDQ